MWSTNISSINHTLTTGVLNAATAAQIIHLPNIACTEITIIAKRGNVGSIFIGASNVSNTNYGVELQASQAYPFEVYNASLLYVYVENISEGFSYVALSN